MAEPRPFIPPLEPVYAQTRDLGWLLVRLTAGGFLLVHGLQKLLGTTITADDSSIEPASSVAFCRHDLANSASFARFRRTALTGRTGGGIGRSGTTSARTRCSVGRTGAGAADGTKNSHTPRTAR